MLGIAQWCVSSRWYEGESRGRGEGCGMKLGWGLKVRGLWELSGGVGR